MEKKSAVYWPFLLPSLLGVTGQPHPGGTAGGLDPGGDSRSAHAARPCARAAGAVRLSTHGGLCPVCHQNKKTKITEKTILFDFPLFCPACSNTTVIDVVKGK